MRCLHPPGLAGVEQLHNPKVHDRDAPLRAQHQVAGLNISVQDPFLVCMIQTTTHLRDHRHGLSWRKSRLLTELSALHLMCEGLARETLHHKIVEPCALTNAVHRNDVGVV